MLLVEEGRIALDDRVLQRSDDGTPAPTSEPAWDLPALRWAV